jgi:hypothetical protein
MQPKPNHLVAFTKERADQEVAMKRLLFLFAAGLALAACDSDIQPTKAPVLDQTPQTDSAPKPATGGEQPPPAQ